MGRTVSKLEGAINGLIEKGISAEAFPGDASDRESVRKLAEYAASKGTVDVLIHAAGVSPAQALYEKVIEINSIGNINVDQEMLKVMPNGSTILNVS